jgi:DNA-binding NtrC family response regulator
LNILKGKNIKNISGEALNILMKYDFQGNVRELENFIEYAFILCRENQIKPHHFPKELLYSFSIRETEDIKLASPLLHQAEAKTIIEVLHRYNGNRVQAASDLGIDKTTLWRKMKKYGITYP